MPTYAVFLRAVNVGQRRVAMSRVRELLSDNGFTDVTTYINSGNVRVRAPSRSAPAVATEVGRLLSGEFGFDVPCVARPVADLVAVAARVDAAPSPLGVEARTYVCFLGGEPDDAASGVLAGWEVEGERAAVIGAHVVIWLTVPSHRATLSNARVEKLTGVVGTTRDLKVVRTLATTWGA